MTPLERAARALHASESNGEQQWDDLDVSTRGAFKRDANAVLQAFREPSERMIEAGSGIGACDGLLNYHGENILPETDAEAAKEVWQAMIDAALEEG